MRILILLGLMSCVSSLTIQRSDLYIVLLRSPGYRQYLTTLSPQDTRIGRPAFSSRAKSQQDSIVHEIMGSRGDKAVRHRYTELANGFSAPLTQDQVHQMRGHRGVKAVFKDGIQKLYTTRSNIFLGYNSSTGIWRKTTGANAIVGIIDTGVWPEHPSFSDKGFTKIPSKFKGTCNPGNDNFKCNKKLVGAQFFGDGAAYAYNTNLFTLVNFFGDYYSPRDINGHGTHTASTAGGSVVSSVTVNGVAFGSPRGTAFSARVSVYKVFWDGSAFESDIIAAMNAAVQDGVDVLSLSLGGGPDVKGSALGSLSYYFAYLTTLSNVPVVYAAGNDGPEWFTVSNAIPWVLTVAASTIDRTSSVTGYLGNGSKIQGLATASPGTPMSSLKKKYPLISSDTAYISLANKNQAELCAPGSLNQSKVAGKIVLCLRGEYALVDKAETVKSVGGVGIIIYNQKSVGNETVAVQFSIPGIAVTYSTGLFIKAYIAKTKSPTAYLLKSTIVTGAAAVEAPAAASFSSAGPNGGSLNIIKPDISAPGVNIFAAWIKNGYQTISGTSMACPHASGAIALLKILHPKWTPSQLFSAVMTTASLVTNRGNPILASGKKATPFKIGAGHLNTNAAADPGLVYPISNLGYNTFLCSEDSGGATSSIVDIYSVCATYPSTKAVDLNLPSVAFYRVNKVASTKRTLQNVGPAGTYTVSVKNPAGATLSVTPTRLVFGAGQRLNYTVRVNATVKSANVAGALQTRSSSSGTISANIFWTFGVISWSDNKGHKVRINVALNSV